MSKLSQSDVEFKLQKLLLADLDAFTYHQWPSEDLRWVELAFALISRIRPNNPEKVREVISKLQDLDLLDIDALGEVKQLEEGHSDMNSAVVRHINEILTEEGFTDSESTLSIITLSEAARSLKQNHEGKIQRYLRRYGQLMVDELDNNFKFSQMKKDDVKYAFTLWLQNVLNMPINLNDKSMDEFYKKLGITTTELIEIADKFDINIALLDDIIINSKSQVSSTLNKQTAL